MAASMREIMDMMSSKYGFNSIYQQRNARFLADGSASLDYYPSHTLNGKYAPVGGLRYHVNLP